MFICDECHGIGYHERGCSQWRYYPDLTDADTKVKPKFRTAKSVREAAE